MPAFGERSKKALGSAHPKLKELFEEVVKGYDCTVLCGFRSQEDQDRAFETGFSKKKWPESKHNVFPSLAVDVAPFPIRWKDEKRFFHFAGYVKAIADKMGIKIRCGVDFNQNNDFTDDHLVDGPHFELVLDTKEGV